MMAAPTTNKDHLISVVTSSYHYEATYNELDYSDSIVSNFTFIHLLSPCSQMTIDLQIHSPVKVEWVSTWGVNWSKDEQKSSSLPVITFISFCLLPWVSHQNTSLLNTANNLAGWNKEKTSTLHGANFVTAGAMQEWNWERIKLVYFQSALYA